VIVPLASHSRPSSAASAPTACADAELAPATPRLLSRLMQPSSRSRWFVAQPTGPDSPGLREGDALDHKVADRIFEASKVIRSAVADSSYAVCLRAIEALEEGSGPSEAQRIATRSARVPVRRDREGNKAARARGRAWSVRPYEHRVGAFAADLHLTSAWPAANVAFV